MRFALSEPDPSPYDLDPLKEAEEARQQAWEDFVTWLREQAQTRLFGWQDVLGAMAAAYSDVARGFTRDDLLPETLEDDGRFYDFADEHGWPDTLRAIAQAMSLDERHKRELFERR